MKIPDPMMPPMTTIVASKGPSARLNCTRGAYHWVIMSLRYHAPYMEWAKTRPAVRFDLATSNVLGCSIDELPGARDTVSLAGTNENGYAPLVEAIAARYGTAAGAVTTAAGASGANFQVCAALLEPGDDVLVERPGYDPLLGAPRLLGANVVRFDRTFEAGYVLDPDRVRRALTPRTRLIVLTSPHNPSGAVAGRPALEAIGRMAESAGVHVLVDEVYLDATDPDAAPAALLGPAFISTSSLTKSYGLAGLRCGWALSSPEVAERIRRARDVIDGTGSIVAERLGVLAFAHLDRLRHRASTLLATNGQMMQTFLRGRPDVEWLDPGGGTVVFPRIPGVTDTGRFAAQLLARYDTAVVPGRFFDAPDHVRLGFGGPTEALAGGLAALGAALDARAW
jgi:aspartate/methionine/tyrosine aminotransferase